MPVQGQNQSGPNQHFNGPNSQIKTAPPPPGYSRSPTPQGQGSVQPANQPHSGPLDANQAVRLNPGQQYRIPNPYQVQQQPIRPGNQPIASNLTKLQEDRRKMSADINVIPENKQPSYIISNSDDVDDVIVRPISQSSVISNQSDNSPKIQPTANNENKQSAPAPSPKSQPAPVEPNKQNYQSSVLRNITADQNSQSSAGKAVPEKSAPTPRQDSAPTPAARRAPAENGTRNQNGTSAKATVNNTINRNSS